MSGNDDDDDEGKVEWLSQENKCLCLFVTVKFHCSVLKLFSRHHVGKCFLVCDPVLILQFSRCTNML